MRSPHPHLVAAFAAAVLLGLAGCGGDDEGSGSTASLDRPDPPARPSAEECERSAPANAAPASPDLVTPPGTYRFRTRGTRTLPDGSRAALPRETRLIVTPAREAGGVRCYRVQRRYSDELGDTAFATVSGETVLASTFRSQGGGQLTEMTLDRPIPVSAEDLGGSGTFTAKLKSESGSVGYDGSVSGQYAAEVFGRRTMNVGGEPVRVVGIELRLSFGGGDLKATERSLRWASLDRNILVAEEVEQERELSGERFRLKYTAELESLEPE